MSSRRTHDAITTNGVIIGGTVHGEGAPLVFLQGALGDGDIDWNQVVGHLTSRFTCYLPSWRGRGLSGDHPDLSYGRLVDDAVAYIDSIGETTGLVGWSGGAGLALSVATESDAVDAVAVAEPSVFSLMDAQEQGTLRDRDRACSASPICSSTTVWPSTGQTRLTAAPSCWHRPKGAGQPSGQFGRHMPTSREPCSQTLVKRS